MPKGGTGIMADPALRRTRRTIELLVRDLARGEATLADLLLVSLDVLLTLAEAADVLLVLLLEGVFALAHAAGEAPPGGIRMDRVALLPRGEASALTRVVLRVVLVPAVVIRAHLILLFLLGASTASSGR
jgi:hypothetical protein